MGDLKVETDALLRDNNFGPDDFSDAVLKNVGFEDWSVVNDGEAVESRRDFREEQTFTIDPNGTKELDDAIHFKTLDDGKIEVGVHVADVAHFIKANSLVDREAKKRGTAVYLMTRTVNMLPPRLSHELCCLSPGEERYTVSIVFKIDPQSGNVLENETWIGKGVIKSSGKLSYEDVDTVLSGKATTGLDSARVNDIKMLNVRYTTSAYYARTNTPPSTSLGNSVKNDSRNWLKIHLPFAFCTNSTMRTYLSKKISSIPRPRTSSSRS
jgi:protein SSD1